MDAAGSQLQPPRKLPSPPPSLESLETRALPNNLTNLAAAVPVPTPDLPDESHVHWLTQVTTEQAALADAATLSDAALTPQHVDEPSSPTANSSSSAETPEESALPTQEKQAPNLEGVLTQLFQFRETYGSNVDALSSLFGDGVGQDQAHATALPQLNGTSGGDAAPLSTPPGSSAPETAAPNSPSADAAQPGQQLENDAEAEAAQAANRADVIPETSAAGPAPTVAPPGQVPTVQPAPTPLPSPAPTPASTAAAPTSSITVVTASARGNLSSSPDPTFPFVVGVSASYQLATFDDPNYVANTSWHETINWDDGTTDNYGSEGAGDGGGTFVVQGTHTYNAAGSYNVQITFADPNGSLSVTNTAAVSPSLGDQSSSVGASVALSIAPTTDGTGLIYTETGLPPGLTLDANTGTLTGTIGTSAVANSPYLATLTTTSAEGNSSSQMITWAIAPATTTTTLSSSDSGSASFGDTITFTANVAGNGVIPTGSVTFLDNGTVLDTEPLDTNGQAASIGISAFAVGNHPITAVYNETTDFSGSTSDTLNQDINPAATTTALSTSNSGAAYGDTVTFTAAVTSGAGLPTGTVDFQVNGLTLDTETLANGSASFSTSSLDVGNDSVVAVYSGDTSFSFSSAGLTQTVNTAATTTRLSASANPIVYGDTPTFTAVVGSNVGQPTGTVTFMLDGSALGTVGLDSTGTATLAPNSNANPLFVGGSHALTAIYNGDSNYSDSSAGMTLAVNQATTALALSSSDNASVYGDSVTFSAVVSSSVAGLPTGTVTFEDNGTLIGSPVNLDSYSTATTTLAPTLGSHAITAVYSGDAYYSSSTTALTQIVNQAATTTTVVSSDYWATYGESVSFTATVSTGSLLAGTPTGTVTFEDNGTPISAALAIASSGQVTFSATLPAGSHAITAVYSGDTYFSGSSAGISQTVSQASTTTNLTSSENASVYGDTVTFTAAVSSIAGTPSGTVTFVDADTGIVLDTETLGNGQATSIGISSLAVGSDDIQANYGGDSNFSTSAGSLSQVVNPANLTLTSLTANSKQYDGTTTATLDTSTAQFSGLIGSDVVTLDASNATVTFDTKHVGMGKTVTATGLDLSGADAGNYTLVNSTFTITADITPYELTVSGITASNKVYDADTTASLILDGATLNGILGNDSVALDTSAIAGTFDTKNVGTGITVSITGLSLNDVDARDYILDSSPVTTAADVTPAPLTVTAEHQGKAFGDPLTFAGSEFTATGLQGEDSIDSVTLSSTGADATSAPGSYSVTADAATGFAFDPADYSVTYVSGTLTVTTAGTATTLTADTSESSLGETVTFVATVGSAAPGLPTPTGTVEFLDSATGLSVNVALDGSGVATYAADALSAGPHTITAIYCGDTDFDGSYSSTVAHTVDLSGDGLSSSTSLASDVSAPVFGQFVTFTATAEDAGGETPTGTVTFQYGPALFYTAPLDASGVATFTVNSLSAGSNSVMAVYNGDGNYASSSDTIGLTVATADTSLTLTADNDAPVFGQALTFTATVTPVAPGAGTPESGVTFLDGTTALSGTVVSTTDVSGDLVVSISVNSLGVGTHTITAQYAAGSDFGAGADSLDLEVGQADTITTLETDADSAISGQSVTFTATITAVTPGGGTPSGAVTFMDGDTALSGTVITDSSSGNLVVHLTTTELVSGDNSITANYSGDTKFAASNGTFMEAVDEEQFADFQFTTKFQTIKSKETDAAPSRLDLQLQAVNQPDPTQPIVYTATGLPAGITIDQIFKDCFTGNIQYIDAPTNGSKDHLVIVTATNGGKSVQAQFHWIVTDVNPLGVVNDQLNQVGDMVNLQLPPVSSPTLLSNGYTVTASNLPAGLTLLNGAIQGVVTAASVLPRFVTISLKDAGQIHTRTFYWTVQDKTKAWIEGPAVVPGNSVYTFKFHYGQIVNPPTTATGYANDPFHVMSSLPPGNYSVVGIESVYTVQMQFKNTAPADVVLIEEVNGRAVASLLVTVVQVIVTDPAASPTAPPNAPAPAPFTKGTFTTKAGTGVSEIPASNGIKSLSVYSGTAAVTPGDPPGLAFQSGVTLIGPNGNQGVDKIQFGFVQHYKLNDWHSTYGDGKTLYATYNGEIGSTNDVTYLDVMMAGAKTGNIAFPYQTIEASDTPNLVFPLTSDQTKVVTGVVPEKLLSKTYGSITFTLDVAASTSDAALGANDLRYAEASVTWLFHTNGTYTFDGKKATWSPAPNDFVVSSPSSWAGTMLAAPLLEGKTGITANQMLQQVAFA